MKKLLLLMVLLVCFIGCNGSGSGDGENDSWTLNEAFSDEFNSDQLDADKWHDHNPQWEGRSPGMFCPENVSVRDGLLRLKISFDPSLPDDFFYACAAIKSKTPLLYGKIEARIKLIDGYAYSGFWLYNVEPGEWTELGILETAAGDPEQESLVCFSSVVWEPYEYQERTCCDVGERLADGFHVHGIERTFFEVRRYYDGRVIDVIPNRHWYQPLYINFSMEVWYWATMPEAKDLPKEMLVDWIRVYQ